MEGGIMGRLDLKVAIIRSGRHQYEIARAIGVSENALSKFICGHGTLRPEHLEKLNTLLGLKNAANEPVCTSADGAGV
jgi:transcriptional regulator with XRE-family HTH domain